MTDAHAHDVLAEALHDVRRRFGEAAFTDRRRLISLLSDKAPDARRDIHAIATAIDEGVPAALTATERHMLGMEIDRQANNLENATGMRVDIARAVVRALAYALDLGPPPSIYQAGAAMPAPVAPAAPAAAGPAIARAPHPAPPATAAPGHRAKGSNRNGLIAGGVAVALLLVAAPFIAKDDPAGTSAVAGRPGAAAQGYAGETVDQGVAPKSELESNVGSPTPLTIPVGRRVTTAEVQRMVADDPSAMLVDVLANPHASTIRNAAFLPIAGMPGTLADATQSQVARGLKDLVADKPQRPLIFFCAGAVCWESYNAMLRADAAGFRNIYWYRGGLASWGEAGLPMQPLPAQGSSNLLFGQ